MRNYSVNVNGGSGAPPITENASNDVELKHKNDVEAQENTENVKEDQIN